MKTTTPQISSEMSARNIEESEIEFKLPLTPGGTSRRFSSAASTTHSQFPDHALPPINVTPTFGLMGSGGVLVSIATFLLDILSDVALVFALWKQFAERPYDYYDRSSSNYAFTATLILFIVPLAIENMISLTWYIRNKKVFGAFGIFYRKSIYGKVICVMLHIFLLGPLVRHCDTNSYGRRTKRHAVEIDLGGGRGSVQTLTPKGELNSILQQELSRDTAMVDMIHSFFKSVPQMLFQIILLQHSYYSAAGSTNSYIWTLTTQIVKIIIALFCVCWSLVSYQDELRRKEPGKMQLPCSAICACLIWRAGTISSRVIAIASFASLQVDSEGGLVKEHADNSSIISFPLITVLILVAHWGFMFVWIYSEKTIFCAKYDGTPQPILELLYDLVMSWVHIFDYVNVKESPTRRRMIFVYIVLLLENTSFILIWYLQLITWEVWIRVMIIFAVESLFILGICSAVGYYSFLHPDKNNVRQINATWRR